MDLGENLVLTGRIWSRGGRRILEMVERVKAAGISFA
jgi:hypothetical protein